MSDEKYNGNGLNTRYKEKLARGNGHRSYGSVLQNRGEKGLAGSDAKDVGGWEAYHRWLTRVQAPEKRRAPVDPGLYTWKGYRSWSDKVRRDWEPDDQ
jgi:hypothetical protein